MNKEETKQILTILKISYPQSFKGWSGEQIKAFIDLWSEAFTDTPTELVVGAVKTIIYTDTREYAPNIAQVKEKICSLTNNDQMTEQEAWHEVKKAISRSGWYANEEFNKLPANLQRLVGNPERLHEWSQMDSDELNTVVASNFMRSYRVRAKADKEYGMLPNDIKNLISFSEVKQLGNDND